MKKSDEMLRLEKNLTQDEEFAEKFALAVKEAINSGNCESDADVMVKAAASLGYEISAGELERFDAEMQSLDVDELASVTGGAGDYGEDEYGHDLRCITVWHCFWVSMHTETNNHLSACWKDYNCLETLKQSMVE